MRCSVPFNGQHDPLVPLLRLIAWGTISERVGERDKGQRIALAVGEMVGADGVEPPTFAL